MAVETRSGFSVVEATARAVVSSLDSDQALRVSRGAKMVDLGTIQIGDRSLQVQYGLTRYPRRLVDHPEQPRVIGENLNPVVRVVERTEQGEEVRSLAYRKDLEELPTEVAHPLIAHLSNINGARNGVH